MDAVIPKTNRKALVTDASFCPKSGKHTDGLGNFWNGCASRAQQGLELSTIALLDVDHRSAYHLSTKQTPSTSAESEESKVDFYGTQLKEFVRNSEEKHQYLVADGYYAKKKYLQTVRECDLHLISKLRHDANLRYLYEGPANAGRGRPKKYDGKVCFDDLSRFSSQEICGGKIILYSLIVNVVNFGCDAKIVIVVDRKNKRRAILFSTDLEMEAFEIFEYYRARFQIEFLFRDAKGHCGLTDFQVRDRASIEFHVNTCLTATSLAHLEMRSKQSDVNERKVFSMTSYKRRKFNEMFIEKILSQLSAEAQIEINNPVRQELLDYGTIKPLAA